MCVGNNHGHRKPPQAYHECTTALPSSAGSTHRGHDSSNLSTRDTSRSTSLQPPTLYVLNAPSLAILNAIEQLTSELIGYDVDIGVISKSRLKMKHANSCVEIVGYSLFNCDRTGRKAGSVAIYVRQSLNATEWLNSMLDPKYEMLWIKVVQNRDVTFICALYHPPSPICDTADLLDIIGNTVLRIHQEHPDSHIILAGDQHPP